MGYFQVDNGQVKIFFYWILYAMSEKRLNDVTASGHPWTFRFRSLSQDLGRLVWLASNFIQTLLEGPVVPSWGIWTLTYFWFSRPLLWPIWTFWYTLSFQSRSRKLLGRLQSYWQYACNRPSSFHDLQYYCTDMISKVPNCVFFDLIKFKMAAYRPVFTFTCLIFGKPC